MVSAPLHFFSHGSTMMLGEASRSADYWKACGDAALRNNVKGVIMMGAHWDARGTNRIDVAMNPKPAKSPVAYVHPSKYVNYELNPDLATGKKVIAALREGGLDARPNDSFDWIHDTFLILIRMFPGGCPPTTIVSMNSRFDPHLHARVGSLVAPFREDGYLIIGTGGAVHNLYRNNWMQMLRYSDNFAQPYPPDAPMLEFRQSVEDVFVRSSGSGRKGAVTRGITRLMKHPMFRDAHATDDHYMAACFIAGAIDASEKSSDKCELGAEDWELCQMCNSQFSFGKWA
ncbi:LigB subunit of an aromatic-ring-opening dioxygenase LigAB [Dothidotthia symphoricarpi CBS 119687]|uniref:LigB subunit of an aromatic-ring-opening dioxygenase LigAB n=1 Tax=Dothidotthia symphoricarpi CBS 119687 TaxID=1392245 RepID=A0A6A6ALQ8_9PLEO|nr:LigB subunit of an aromatic-ring-opening dioxygenase LigAB [Dothidotthia symphoricarpi CBS 119687]KAF2132058.1 LigB subunit of an aromatic-ring-opening dioxygenase LigAB [Dothidotthia symphoricarpi CBS 119687]